MAMGAEEEEEAVSVDIVLRATKGSELSHEEMDSNFNEVTLVKDRVTTLESGGGGEEPYFDIEFFGINEFSHSYWDLVSTNLTQDMIDAVNNSESGILTIGHIEIEMYKTTNYGESEYGGVATKYLYSVTFYNRGETPDYGFGLTNLGIDQESTFEQIGYQPSVGDSLSLRFVNEYSYANCIGRTSIKLDSSLPDGLFDFTVVNVLSDSRA